MFIMPAVFVAFAMVDRQRGALAVIILSPTSFVMKTTDFQLVF